METNNILSNIYGKKFAIPVYSGTLAIEGILKSLNTKKKTRVLISSFVCYSILEAIINSGMIPVIATPSRGIVFKEKELYKIIKEEKIDIFIAVHQYGYYQYIPKVQGLTIIEDLSQAWDIKKNGEIIGSNSDYLIFSFGTTKPLSNGIGGIILSDKDIGINFDLKTKDCRYSQIPLLEYYMSIQINYKKLINKAKKIVKKQRNNAILFNKAFSNSNYIKNIYDETSIPSYHRYVIEVNKKNLGYICKKLNQCNIKFQKEFKLNLTDLPVVQNKKIKTIKIENNYSYLLLKTDNKKRNIKKLIKELRS